MFEKDERVNVPGFGSGKILGFYEGNKFPIHILFDDGQCHTFPVECQVVVENRVNCNSFSPSARAPRH